MSARISESDGPAHVLHLVWSLERGGAEVLLLDLVRHTDRARFHHNVCVMGGDGPLRPLLEAEGCQVHLLARRSRLDSVAMVWRGARHIRRVRPDVLHLHCSGPDYWGQLIAALSGHPRVVVTEHSVYLSERRLGKTPSRVKTWIRRGLQFSVSRTITISEAVRTDLRRWRLMKYGRMVVIPNGVDTDVFHPGSPEPLTRSPPTIGSVGRLVTRKGFHVLLEALVLLNDRHRMVRGAIAGNGPEVDRLTQQVRALGLDGIVSLAGEQARVPAFLGELDIFVLPSLREGFGISLVEAMACGLPVVASEIDGVVEIIEHERNGLLVPPNDPKALAEALERYLSDPAWARQLGRTARRTAVERFNIVTMTRSYEHVYSEVLAS